ncbi:MAG: carbamoyl-phosphate synthase large subunit, partial [Planctomycetota bacterium]|nr:carbamoyl-phosphate synthase large subunit [Planctomycetota bacterium]
KEALQKALRSLETKRAGLGCDARDELVRHMTREQINELLSRPNEQRIFALRLALKAGYSIQQICDLTGIDPWFIRNIEEITEVEERLRAAKKLEAATTALLREAKRNGFSDAQLAHLWGCSENAVRAKRKALGVAAAFKLVDTCAAEFEAYTPYYYSTYEDEDEAAPRLTSKKKIMILGGGPNRIGQGIEFDYCCVHAAFAMRELGYESIMVNSNPETVSTDYDTSDLLFFEPLTFEDVMNVHDKVTPDGTIVQFGGQTPLNLARRLHDAGVRIIGTSVDSIEAAEDRKLFNALVERLNLNQASGGTATNVQEAKQIAARIGYPVLVRPSYVLGGRAMEICYHPSNLVPYIEAALEAGPDAPVLIDKFLEDAIEVDVDAVADGTDVVIAGVLEHIEEAGTHSGDAAMALPPHSLSDSQIAEISETTRKLAEELKVVGLMNIQYAVKGKTVYVLEVNPRASRTVPFVSKATGIPWAKVAAKCMVGLTLKQQGISASREVEHICVKESVFPFNKFLGNDTILGPEMKSTGEVMGIDTDFGRAFAKAQMAAGQTLPSKGKVFLSVCDADKRDGVQLAKELVRLGFSIITTAGTHKTLARHSIPSQPVRKISEGRPNIGLAALEGWTDSGGGCLRLRGRFCRQTMGTQHAHHYRRIRVCGAGRRDMFR